jgi:hypothetical protein
MWQSPANNVPHLSRKGYQPHGFDNSWVSRVEVFAMLYGAFAQSAPGTEYVMLLLLFDTPIPG